MVFCGFRQSESGPIAYSVSKMAATIKPEVVTLCTFLRQRFDCYQFKLRHICTMHRSFFSVGDNCVSYDNCLYLSRPVRRRARGHLATYNTAVENQSSSLVDRLRSPPVGCSTPKRLASCCCALFHSAACRSVVWLISWISP